MVIEDYSTTNSCKKIPDRRKNKKEGRKKDRLLTIPDVYLYIIMNIYYAIDDCESMEWGRVKWLSPKR
ncbi:hypothetical protein BBO01nite_05130 [Brevibacillus borstelensis]|nr:hypothetical protein BBO01nite_05130 [Brevibacillus borstelensis]